SLFQGPVSEGDSDRDTARMQRRLVQPVHRGITVSRNRALLIERSLIRQIQGDDLGSHGPYAQRSAGNESQKLALLFAGQSETGTDDIHIGGRTSRVEAEIGHLRLLIGIACTKRNLPGWQ